MAALITDVLHRIETHASADRLPRSLVEFHGAFAVTISGDPSRPAAARLASSPDVAGVLRARKRQRELDIPERVEWVHELLPTAAVAVRAAGFVVQRHQLMVLDELVPHESAHVTIERLGPGTPDDLAALAYAVSNVADACPDPTARSADSVQVQLAAALLSRPSELPRVRSALTDPRTTVWLARYDGEPAATAGARRIGSTVEVTGVGTVPALRGRGIASALTSAVCAEALDGAPELIFLSAASERVAAIYERLGFRAVGTLCVAEPADVAGA